MARPRRVFHLIKSLGRGGAEVLLSDGPSSSAPERFQYGFGYFLPHKNALVTELSSIGPVTCFSAKSAGEMLLRVPAVVRELKRFRADVVHCHLPLAGVVGRLAAKVAGVPVIYTEHNAIERYHAGTRLLAKSTWRLQRRVIAVSGDVADSIGRNFGTSVPVSVVRNGVSTGRFLRDPQARLAARRELGLLEDAPVIGSVAVFRKQKRLDLWLECAQELAKSQPEMRFLLVGDGPLRGEVEAGIRSRGLSEKVILPGLKPDVRPYLAAMDVYLMTSDFEGVPIALLEAMSMETIPVATDAGGIPEVIEHERSGFVRPRGDVAALVRDIRDIVGLPPTARAELGQRARNRIETAFGTRRMMEEIEELYDRTV